MCSSYVEKHKLLTDDILQITKSLANDKLKKWTFSPVNATLL